MVSRTSDWRGELGRWLKPFVDRLGHKARRQMCPLYVSGLIGSGDRKSVQPMAERVALGDYDQLHLGWIERVSRPNIERHERNRNWLWWRLIVPSRPVCALAAS
jgi:SRSO17 transposase